MDQDALPPPPPPPPVGCLRRVDRARSSFRPTYTFRPSLPVQSSPHSCLDARSSHPKPAPPHKNTQHHNLNGRAEPRGRTASSRIESNRVGWNRIGSNWMGRRSGANRRREKTPGNRSTCLLLLLLIPCGREKRVAARGRTRPHKREHKTGGGGGSCQYFAAHPPPRSLPLQSPPAPSIPVPSSPHTCPLSGSACSCCGCGREGGRSIVR